MVRGAAVAVSLHDGMKHTIPQSIPHAGVHVVSQGTMGLQSLSLLDDDGRIAVPGIYDEVVPLSPEARERLKKLPFDEGEFRADTGMLSEVQMSGERGYTPYELMWHRPAISINALEAAPLKGASNQIVDSARARVGIRTVRTVRGITCVIVHWPVLIDGRVAWMINIRMSSEATEARQIRVASKMKERKQLEIALALKEGKNTVLVEEIKGLRSRAKEGLALIEVQNKIVDDAFEECSKIIKKK